MQDAENHHGFILQPIINAVGRMNETASVGNNCFNVPTGERVRGQHFECINQINSVAIGLKQSESVDRIAIDILEVPFGIGRQLITGH